MNPMKPVYLGRSWHTLTNDEQIQKFFALSREDADELFLDLSKTEQKFILERANLAQAKIWIRLLAPDDAADLIQSFPVHDQNRMIRLLDHYTKTEVRALIAYQEDKAGGLMSTRFSRVREMMTAEEALRYLRAQTPASPKPSTMLMS